MDAKDWIGVLILFATQAIAFVKMVMNNRTRISLLEQSLKNMGNGSGLAVMQAKVEELGNEIKELRRAKHDMTTHLARHETMISGLEGDVEHLRKKGTWEKRD